MDTANFGRLTTARQLLSPDTDVELLRRFTLDRDDTAFARLVTRYGRLVLAACRRIDLKQMLCGASPDGQWLLTRRIYSKNLELSKVPLRGGAPEPLATFGLDRGTARLSPDGRSVACLGHAPQVSGKVPDSVPAVRVVDVRTGEVTEIARHEDGGWPAGLSWSPDGKSLAYLLGSVHDDKYRPSLIVCDARGKDARTVFTLDDKPLDYVWDGWQLIGWFPTPPKSAPQQRQSAPSPSAPE